MKLSCSVLYDQKEKKKKKNCQIPQKSIKVFLNSLNNLPIYHNVFLYRWVTRPYIKVDADKMICWLSFRSRLRLTHYVHHHWSIPGVPGPAMHGSCLRGWSGRLAICSTRPIAVPFSLWTSEPDCKLAVFISLVYS